MVPASALSGRECRCAIKFKHTYGGKNEGFISAAAHDRRGARDGAWTQMDSGIAHIYFGIFHYWVYRGHSDRRRDACTYIQRPVGDRRSRRAADGGRRRRICKRNKGYDNGSELDRTHHLVFHRADDGGGDTFLPLVRKAQSADARISARRLRKGVSCGHFGGAYHDIRGGRHRRAHRRVPI